MHDTTRRDLLRLLAGLLPVTAVAAGPPPAGAQAPSLVKVDTKGLVARIKFEHPVQGYLSEINGRYKLRVTELTLEPGGHVGEHNHLGPGIRMVTFGEMTYVLPEKTIVYQPGDFFFESGDINHTVYNRSDKPNQHLLFEILPMDVAGPSLIPVKHRTH